MDSTPKLKISPILIQLCHMRNNTTSYFRQNYWMEEINN
uniref:Uncharacterized protein n=1 Tax=Siphoviridae sp. ct1is2 TaxID=2826273 RepID=A0A8S5NNC9_9CAUD|nr:MAG TPA: hypothetical protein [Siphoviridae sp. ct1is2]